MPLFSLEFWLIMLVILILLIVYFWYYNKITYVKILSLALTAIFLIIIVPRYLHTLSLILFFLSILIILLHIFGLTTSLWVPLAFLVWVPFPLPVLPPFMGVLLNDSSITELIILTGFILWIFYALTSSILHRGSIRAVPYWRWLGLFLLGGIISFFVGTFLKPITGFDSQVAWVFLRRVCFLSLALYVLMVQSIRKPKDAEKIMIAFLMGAIVMGLFILRGERLLTYEALELGERTRGEFMGWFALPFGLILLVGGNTTSAHFAMVALLSFSLWLNGLLRWQRAMGFCSFVLSSILTIGMSTRGIWVAIIPSIILVIFLSVKKRSVSLKKYFIGSLIALAVIIWVCSFLLSRLTDVSYRFETLKSPASLRADSSFITRVEQYRELGAIFIKNPLGVGYMDSYKSTMIHPHSLYLKLALMTGIFGLIGYTLFLIFILRYWYAKLPLISPQASWIAIGAISVVLLILLYGFTGDVLWRPHTYTSFILICGIATAVAQISKES